MRGLEVAAWPATLACSAALRFFLATCQSAVRAVAGHFNHVLQFREAVLLAHCQRPVLKGGCFQLNGGAASAAEQVVVMIFHLAVAVQGLTFNALD